MNGAERLPPPWPQRPVMQAKTLRIALIDPAFYTVAYDAELARALADQGHEVTMWGNERALDEERAEFAHLRPLFYKEMAVRSRERQVARFVRLRWRTLQLIRIVLHLRAMQRLIAELRVGAPDVIHFQWSPFPTIDRLFMRSLQQVAPLVLTVHDSCPFNGDNAPRPQRWGITSMFKEFDGVIIHTEAAREKLISYGVSPDRIVHIPHGALHDNGAVKAPQAAFQRPIHDRVRFLLFGRLKPYKGADLLLEAVRRLPADIQDRIEVQIVGKPYMDIAPLLNSARELKARVQLDLRFVPDDEMRNLLSLTDVMVFPYREIDTSGVLMAALRYGRPIIASRVGAFAELLVNGQHGLLIPPGDTDALAAAMACLCCQAHTRAAMGTAVGELSATIPSWDEIARRTTDLYCSLLHPTQI